MAAVIPQTLAVLDREVFVLCTSKGTAAVVRLVGDTLMAHAKAASGMWLTGAYRESNGAAAVVLASRQGAAQWLRPPARGKRVPIDGAGAGARGYLTELVVAGNVLYALGYRKQVYRFDDGAWTAIDGLLEDERQFMAGGTDLLGKLVVLQEGREGSVLSGWDGTAWSRTATLEPGLRCVCADGPRLAAAGSGVLVEVEDGRVTTTALRVGGAPYEAWSLTRHEDAWVVSDHHSAFAVRGDSLVDLHAPPDVTRAGVSHNRCLASRGHELLFARRDGLFRRAAGTWTQLSLGG